MLRSSLSIDFYFTISYTFASSKNILKYSLATKPKDRIDCLSGSIDIYDKYSPEILSKSQNQTIHSSQDIGNTSIITFVTI